LLAGVDQAAYFESHEIASLADQTFSLLARGDPLVVSEARLAQFKKGELFTKVLKSLDHGIQQEEWSHHWRAEANKETGSKAVLSVLKRLRTLHAAHKKKGTLRVHALNACPTLCARSLLPLTLDLRMLTLIEGGGKDVHAANDPAHPDVGTDPVIDGGNPFDMLDEEGHAPEELLAANRAKAGRKAWGSAKGVSRQEMINKRMQAEPAKGGKPQAANWSNLEQITRENATNHEREAMTAAALKAMTAKEKALHFAGIEEDDRDDMLCSIEDSDERGRVEAMIESVNATGSGLEEHNDDGTKKRLSEEARENPEAAAKGDTQATDEKTEENQTTNAEGESDYLEHTWDDDGPLGIKYGPHCASPTAPEAAKDLCGVMLLEVPPASTGFPASVDRYMPIDRVNGEDCTGWSCDQFAERVNASERPLTLRFRLVARDDVDGVDAGRVLVPTSPGFLQGGLGGTRNKLGSIFRKNAAKKEVLHDKQEQRKQATAKEAAVAEEVAQAAAQVASPPREQTWRTAVTKDVAKQRAEKIRMTLLNEMTPAEIALALREESPEERREALAYIADEAKREEVEAVLRGGEGEDPVAAVDTAALAKHRSEAMTASEAAARRQQEEAEDPVAAAMKKHREDTLVAVEAPAAASDKTSKWGTVQLRARADGAKDRARRMRQAALAQMSPAEKALALAVLGDKEREEVLGNLDPEERAEVQGKLDVLEADLDDAEEEEENEEDDEEEEEEEEEDAVAAAMAKHREGTMVGVDARRKAWTGVKAHSQHAHEDVPVDAAKEEEDAVALTKHGDRAIEGVPAHREAWGSVRAHSRQTKEDVAVDAAAAEEEEDAATKTTAHHRDEIVAAAHPRRKAWAGVKAHSRQTMDAKRTQAMRKTMLAGLEPDEKAALLASVDPAEQEEMLNHIEDKSERQVVHACLEGLSTSPPVVAEEGDSQADQDAVTEATGNQPEETLGMDTPHRANSNGLQESDGGSTAAAAATGDISGAGPESTPVAAKRGAWGGVRMHAKTTMQQQRAAIMRKAMLAGLTTKEKAIVFEPMEEDELHQMLGMLDAEERAAIAEMLAALRGGAEHLDAFQENAAQVTSVPATGSAEGSAPGQGIALEAFETDDDPFGALSPISPPDMAPVSADDAALAESTKPEEGESSGTAGLKPRQQRPRSAEEAETPAATAEAGDAMVEDDASGEVQGTEEQEATGEDGAEMGDAKPAAAEASTTDAADPGAPEGDASTEVPVDNAEAEGACAAGPDENEVVTDESPQAEEPPASASPPPAQAVASWNDPVGGSDAKRQALVASFQARAAEQARLGVNQTPRSNDDRATRMKLDSPPGVCDSPGVNTGAGLSAPVIVPKVALGTGGRSVAEIVTEPSFLSSLLLLTNPDTAASFLQESLRQADERMDLPPEFLGKLLERTPPRTAARFLANMQQLEQLASLGVELESLPGGGPGEETLSPGEGQTVAPAERVVEAGTAKRGGVANRASGKRRYVGKDSFENLPPDTKAKRIAKLPRGAQREELWERVGEEEIEQVRALFAEIPDANPDAEEGDGSPNGTPRSTGKSKLSTKHSPGKRKGLARIQAMQEADAATKQAKQAELVAAQAQREQAEAELVSLQARAKLEADTALEEERRLARAELEAELTKHAQEVAEAAVQHEANRRAGADHHARLQREAVSEETRALAKYLEQRESAERVRNFRIASERLYWCVYNGEWGEARRCLAEEAQCDVDYIPTSQAISFPPHALAVQFANSFTNSTNSNEHAAQLTLTRSRRRMNPFRLHRRFRGRRLSTSASPSGTTLPQSSSS